MHNADFRVLMQLAEGVDLPPPPEKQAKNRAAVQAAYESLTRLMPSVQARVSSLSPRLIGQDIGSDDAAEVVRGCDDLSDLARQLGTSAEKLRTAVERFQKGKKEPSDG